MYCDFLGFAIDYQRDMTPKGSNMNSPQCNWG